MVVAKPLTDRAAGFRLAALIVACASLALVPLGVLAYTTTVASTEVVAEEVEHRVESAATIAGSALGKEMDGLRDVVQSYATRPSVVAAIASPDRDTRLDFHLDQLQRARPGVTVAFATDAGGRLLGIRPATPEILDVDFSHRDWYRGVVHANQPYVSEAYQSAATGNPLVVAAAAPVMADDGTGPQRIGIIVAAYDLAAIQRFGRDSSRRT